jgi:hypothetical protein
MRKIEQKMVSAIMNRKSWQGGNTTVSIRDDNSVSVFLHGNHIADFGTIVGCNRDYLVVNTDTLRRWSTNTTKSRLRALGANVSTRKGVTYLHNVAI